MSQLKVNRLYIHMYKFIACVLYKLLVMCAYVWCGKKGA